MTDFAKRIRVAARISLFAGGISTVALLTACDLTQNQLKMDRDGNREFQDYRDALGPRSPESAGTKTPAADIPALQAYVAPPSSNVKPMPLVSISVNQTVPLRDALFELAQQAGYDIELDPRITGSIIFTAHDKPFDEVVQRISDIAGLRAKFTDNTVRVEMDTPFQKVYKVDYLNYVRKNKSSVNDSIAVVSGSNVNSGSAFGIDGQSEADFWGELSSSLQQILGVAQTVSSLKTSADPQISAVAKTAPVAQTNGGTAATTPDGAPAAGTTAAPQTTPPQANLQVQSLPTDANAPAGTQSDDDKKAMQAGFAVNKQAGIITVFATDRQQKKIAAYLDEVRRSVTAQVLIEAKVMEVSLGDQYSAGINWSAVAKGVNLGAGFGGSAVAAGAGLTNVAGTVATNVVRGTSDPFSFVPEPSLAGASNFRVGYTNHDVSAIIDAISQFGTVHALSSPRLTVLNNQSAVLNVANNVVYFTLQFTTTTVANGPSQTDATSTVHSVPVGVLINVQPSINLTDNTVSMAIRPTVTRIVGEVADPAVTVELATAAAAGATIPNIQSNVPEVNVQEMDSVINLHSGEAVVMGGLMQDRSVSGRTAVPVLGELPYVGALFRQQNDTNEKTELVIFLKATIMDNASGATQTDKDLYRQFSNDRRPLDL